MPEDIQIAGIGDSSLSGVTEPSLTTVHLYYEEAGTEAARLLFDLIQNGEAAIQKEVKLDCKLIVQGIDAGRGAVMKKAADNTPKSFKSVRFRKVYGKIHLL